MTRPTSRSRRRRTGRRTGRRPGAALVRSAATDVVPPLADLGRVHIMGIAGAGMSGLARILLERGVEVSGCEARDSLAVAGAARARAPTVHIGHSVDHLDDADTFVYTTAINPQAPRVRRRARERHAGAAPRRRARRGARGPAHASPIAGTHGKTSTTSLLTVGAQACGVDPSFAIGGNLYETGKNAHLGTGELAIVEADESDGSFLLTRPAAAIVTNVEADHLENHGDLEGIFRAFELFVDRVDARRAAARPAPTTPGARVVAEYARATGRRVRTLRRERDADVAGQRRRVRSPTRSSSTSPAELGAERHVRVGALDRAAHGAQRRGGAGDGRRARPRRRHRHRRRGPRFGGVHRRFESHGVGGGVRVFDDYAHHPTEIAAQLRAARDGGRRRRPADRGVPARHLQPHPDLRRASSPTRWPWPTSRSSWTSSRRARSRSPASPARRSAT